MPDLAFNERFQAQVTWWVPDSPEKTLSGSIEWVEGKADVDLNGSFLELETALTNQVPPAYPAIHGISRTGDKLTILRAQTSRRQFNFGSAGLSNSQTLRAYAVAIGAHISPDSRYAVLRVRIPRLPIWLGRSAIQQKVTRATGLPARMSYEIEGLPEEVIKSENLEIGFGINVALGTPVGGNVTITSSGWLRIAGTETQTLDWLLDRMGAITTLLSIVAGSTMNPDLAIAELDNSGEKVNLLLNLQHSRTCSLSAPNEFFLLRQNLGIPLDALVNGWLERYESLQMPAQLALSVLTTDELWSHVEFLSLMQALEGLHRAKFKGTYVSPGEYEPIMETLIAAIPASVNPDHRTSLKSRIKFGNEVSLAKRLTELVSKLDVKLRERLLGGDGRLPRSWVDTRNYFTHWDEASREGKLNPVKMHYASARLRLLLRALLLDATGIPTAQIYEALGGGHKESQYLLQLNAAAHEN